MMNGWMLRGAPGAMWGMMLMMGVGVLLLVAAIGLVAYLVPRPRRKDEAEMVLRRRLAVGEITESEYKERLAALRR